MSDNETCATCIHFKRQPPGRFDSVAVTLEPAEIPRPATGMHPDLSETVATLQTVTDSGLTDAVELAKLAGTLLSRAVSPLKDASADQLLTELGLRLNMQRPEARELMRLAEQELV